MDFVYIDRVLWKTLGNHAKREFPHECIGYFEAEHVCPGSIRITQVFSGKNVAPVKERRVAGLLDRKSERDLLRLDKKNPTKIYGMYHSHPESGTIWLGEKDSFNGKIYKRFRHQMIIGVLAKGKKTRKAFYFYKKPLWSEVEIIVK